MKITYRNKNQACAGVAEMWLSESAVFPHGNSDAF